MPKKFKTQRAFTLVELIMVIVIVGILVGVLSQYTKTVIKLWRLTSFRNETVSQARLGLSRMAREMRQLLNNTSVITANASTFQFIDVNGNTIQFSGSANGPLNRTLGETANVLVSTIASASIFTYYDSAGNTIATPTVSPSATNIKWIKVTLQVQAGTQTNTLFIQVYPRIL